MIFEYDLDLEDCEVKNNANLSMAGEFPFRTNCWAKFTTGPKYYTKAAGIAQYQLIFTLSGMGVVMRDGKIMPLNPGSAVLVGYHEHITEYRRISPLPWVMKWVRFDGNNVGIYKSLLSDTLEVVSFENPCEFERKLDMIPVLFADSTIEARAKEFAVVADLLYDMLHAAAKNNARHSDLQGRSDISVTELAGNIILSPELPFNLDEYSRKMSISKYTLIRQFARIYGDTPYQFILKNRIRKAESLLLMENLSINDIAEQCGFCDAPALIHQFKKIKGISPVTYRNEHRKIKLDDLSFLKV